MLSLGRCLYLVLLVSVKLLAEIVSKMTYNVMSRTLNYTLPYHTCYTNILHFDYSIQLLVVFLLLV